MHALSCLFLTFCLLSQIAFTFKGLSQRGLDRKFLQQGYSHMPEEKRQQAERR